MDEGRNWIHFVDAVWTRRGKQQIPKKNSSKLLINLLVLILHLPSGSVPAVWLTSSAHTGGRTCVFIPVACCISHYKLRSWHSNKQSHYWFICRSCVFGFVFLTWWGGGRAWFSFPKPPSRQDTWLTKLSLCLLRQRLKLGAKVHWT